MQGYGYDDPYEREPLGASHAQYETPPRQAASPYHDDASPPRYTQNSNSPAGPRDRQESHSHPYVQQASEPPPPPRHGDGSYYNYGNTSRSPAPYAVYAAHPPPTNMAPGSGQLDESASGDGVAGMAYGVADRNGRDPGIDSTLAPGQIPPPPSRVQYPSAPRQPYSPHNSGYVYDPSGNGRGGNVVDPDSHSSLNPFSTPVATSGSHSPARSLRSFSHSDPYVDDPYQSSFPRNPHSNLGLVDPNDIEDDGDDGLHYSRRSQRNSMLSASNSERGGRHAVGAAAVGGAAAAGGAALAKSGGAHVYDAGAGREKSAPNKRHSKRWRWAVIILVFLVVAAAIVGGVVGTLLAGRRGNSQSNSGSGGSAEDDSKKNGDLGINSQEIKDLMNNPNLHRVFPGMDYTPYNTQYPDCMHNPPSQNNVTRDVAVLGQLTNKIRLYGTDCNQTQMVIHAVDQLKLKDQVKIWLGVWQDSNETTNARQLEQMWTILDDYGDSYFEGIIVANEVLFRKDMSIATLGTIMDNVRRNLTAKKISLPVATSDLGDDWTAALAADSDYIMANVHPFFSGVTAEEAASWTWSFWKEHDGPFWKSDTSKNIISETGWPSAGGKNCGQATTCSNGAVAGIQEMNRFMSDWVCQALDNGTNYFWFEAFDEPWKIRFNEKGKEWEDKWGLMDINRKLKDGVKIPDCGGKTVS